MKPVLTARARSLRTLFFLLISLTISCGSKPDEPIVASAGSAADSIAQADKLYAERADLQRVREGLAHLRQARAAEPGSYEAAWKLSRMSYYLGEHTENSGERDKAFEDGVKAGREAIKLQEQKPEGHFWLGANLGGQAQHSALAGYSSANDIRSEMQKVISLDEGFMSGSAYMALARVDLEIPPVMGGDPKRAVELLEKGLKFGENNAQLRYYLAQGYLKLKRNDDARKQLETIINMQPDPSYVPEHMDAVTKARQLMQKV